MHCIHSVRTKSSTPDLLMKTTGVKTEVVEGSGDVVRGLEKGATKGSRFQVKKRLLAIKDVDLQEKCSVLHKEEAVGWAGRQTAHSRTNVSSCARIDSHPPLPSISCLA